jgi:hypothetical protein
MRFHGITMTGPFINQKLAELPTFDPARDQGRLVWLTDGSLWYGSDIEWVSFSSGAGDANEVEDMYSDLLRTTIFMHASYDEFADEDLIETTNMTFNGNHKMYEYTSGETITSVNLFDENTGLTYVDYVLVYAHYVDTGVPTIRVSSDGGAHWYTVDNLKVFQIPVDNAGADLRLRFIGGGTGTLHSWGVLYNKDLSASCTKYGLTQANFETFEGQTNFELVYSPGAVQVYLNGFLLDSSDYDTSTEGLLVLNQPCNEGDLVTIVSYSSSIMTEGVEYIRVDGSLPFADHQSMGGFKLINMADGTVDADAVNLGQLNAGLSTKLNNTEAANFIKNDGTVTFIANQSMGSYKITNLANGTVNSDAINLSQLNSGLSTKADTSALDNFIKNDGTVTFIANQPMGGFKLTGLANGSNTTDSVTYGQVQNLLSDKVDIVSLPSTLSARNNISGFDCSPDVDSDHDVLVQPGFCMDRYNVEHIFNTSSMVKRFDAAWSAGTGNGAMLDGAALSPNTVYIFFVIYNTVSNIVDFGALNLALDVEDYLPSGYDRYRALRFYKTDSIGNLCQTVQNGDYITNNLASDWKISTTVTTSFATINHSSMLPIDMVELITYGVTDDTTDGAYVYASENGASVSFLIGRTSAGAADTDFDAWGYNLCGLKPFNNSRYFRSDTGAVDLLVQTIKMKR